MHRRRPAGHVARSAAAEDLRWRLTSGHPARPASAESFTVSVWVWVSVSVRPGARARCRSYGYRFFLGSLFMARWTMRPCWLSAALAHGSLPDSSSSAWSLR